MSLRNARIAVTGATGFIGRYIVSALLERGAHVIAVVRNPDRVPAFRARGVELRRADLADEEKLTEGFRGADAVVSNAALMPFSGSSRDELVSANVEGVRHVCHALKRAEVARVVHMSSASVYKTQRGHRYVEDDPLRGTNDTSFGSYYPVSKAFGEQEAWKLADECQLELTVMRPSGVFGAFDEHSFTHHFRKVVALPVAPFPIFTYVPNSYAGDVAEAICLALERETAIGRAYNLASPPGERTFYDHYVAWKKAGGKAAKVVIPVPAPYRVEYSIERAEQDLGWSNRPLEDAFLDMFDLEESE